MSGFTLPPLGNRAQEAGIRGGRIILVVLLASLMDSQRYRARLPRSGKVMRRSLQHQSTRRRCWVHGTGVTSRFVRGRSRSASDPGQSVTPRMQRGGPRKCNSFNHRWPPRQHCSSPARQVTTAARRAGHLPPTLTHDALRLSWAQLGSTPVQKDRISARRSATEGAEKAIRTRDVIFPNRGKVYPRWVYKMCTESGI